jgi:hypothetical protein
LDQLNLPLDEKISPTRPSSSSDSKSTTTGQERRRKSNLCAPYPPNMPLALLKLMESYVIGLSELPTEKGGWSDAKRERGLALVKSLSGHLGDAERLSSSTSPSHLELGMEGLICSTTTFTTYCSLDGPFTDLPRCDPTFAHVRRERMDFGDHVCNRRVVLPRFRSIDIGRRRCFRSFRYVPFTTT